MQRQLRLPLVCAQNEELMKSKVELEDKISTLLHERDELRSRITIAVNNEGLDTQRQEVCMPNVGECRCIKTFQAEEKKQAEDANSAQNKVA